MTGIKPADTYQGDKKSSGNGTFEERCRFVRSYFPFQPVFSMRHLLSLPIPFCPPHREDGFPALLFPRLLYWKSGRLSIGDFSSAVQPGDTTSPKPGDREDKKRPYIPIRCNTVNISIPYGLSTLISRIPFSNPPRSSRLRIRSCSIVSHEMPM